MSTEGPELERLLRRLASCPSEFLSIAGDGSGADAMAIICDHLRQVSPAEPPELSTSLKEIRSGAETRLKLLAIICWMLHDEWFLGRPELASATWRLLVSPKLTKLATLMSPDRFVLDSDRREELARLCLNLLELRPLGETAVHALDRLTTLDSAERERVLRATAAAERRAREVREAMAKKKAQESASRYGE